MLARYSLPYLPFSERILVDAEKVQTPSVPTERREELARLARQWELQLYRQAPSYEAYVDASTFDTRVQELVKRANSQGEVIAQQHYRLHLLRHAMICNAERCTVTPFCRDAKDVVLHMEECRELHCQVPCCGTMRQLTMHSARCQTKDDQVCQICDPDARMPDRCPLCKAEDPANERGPPSGRRAARASLRQEYLLTLFHASLCPHEEDGHCLTSPLCFDVKRLWLHKIYCVDRQCRYPLCATSRAAIDLYNSCTDGTCAVCPAVRATREKHGIERIAADASIEAKLDKKPSAGSDASKKPSARGSDGSSSDVAASQKAIYVAIHRKSGRSSSSSSNQNGRPDSIVTSSHVGTTDDAAMSDMSDDASPDDPLDKSIKSEGALIQMREYERLRQAHRRRARRGSSSSSPPASSNSPEANGEAKRACLSRGEDRKLPADERE